MKAIVSTTYGSPEILQLKEVEKPTPKPNEVLIKIHATAINDYDWSMVRGKPHVYRLMFGLTKPKRPIPGMELSGTVEALGKEVKSFKVGDAVYGDISAFGFGSFAEYICINEKAIVHKPEKMTFVEAAAISHAAMLAKQGLMDIGQIQPGQKILINGAGGGVGTFALQMAKMYDNVSITGVDTGDKLATMESIGFDEVIDYKKVDFTKSGLRYDLILDAKTTRGPSAYKRALTPNGKYVTVGGNLMRIIQILIRRSTGKKNMHLVALQSNRDLEYINELFEAGKIKPVIDGPYPLSETPQAISLFGAGKHKGKVVIGIC